MDINVKSHKTSITSPEDCMIIGYANEKYSFANAVIENLNDII